MGDTPGSRTRNQLLSFHAGLLANGLYPHPSQEEEFLNSFRARFWPSPAIPQDIYLRIQQVLHKCLFLFGGGGVILDAHVEEEVKAQRSKDSPRQRSETERTQPDFRGTQASLSVHCLGLTASSTAAEETAGPVNIPAPDKQHTEE